MSEQIHENIEKPSVTASDYNGPKEYVGLHAHSNYSELDGIATPAQYAEACYKRGYPTMAATEHGHMGSVPDMYFEFRKRGLRAIPGCFLPTQSIYTINGIKQISTINYNDLVLTHHNNYKKVKNVQIRHHEGQMIHIKAWCTEDQICTPEHPFLIREITRWEEKKGVWKEEIKLNWIQAKDLKREKYWRTYDSKRSKDRSNKRRYKFYLCIPRLQSPGIKEIYLANYIFKEESNLQLNIKDDIIKSATYHRNNSKTKVIVNLPKFLVLDNQLLWIMGLWLAEGSTGIGNLVFSLCADEYHFYEKIADYFAEFNIKTSYRFKKNSLEVSVNSMYFKRLFISLFGSGFADKKLNPKYNWLHELSPTQTEALLNGLFDGDAKITTQQSYLKLNNETLIWQVRLLLTKLNIPQASAITKIENNNTDNFSYTIRRRESGHYYYDYDEKYIYLPVYDIQKINYKGYVYNLEVEDDNSYFTGVAVHNCEIYYNDYEPKRQELIANDVKIRSPEWRKDNLEISQRIFRNRHLTVLCKNEIGFHNLIKLTTQAYETGLFGLGRKQYNRIWFDKLCEYKEGLIVLSGCLNGPVCHELRLKEIKTRENEVLRERSIKERFDDAVKQIKKFKVAFGEDYFIELQMPGVEDDIQVFRWLIMLANQFKIKTVIATDSHYLERKDFQLQKIMMAIAQETTVDSPDLFHVNSDEQYFKTRGELWERFKNFGYSNGIDDGVFEESCDNTLLIAERCKSFEIDTAQKIPELLNADIEIKKTVAHRLHKLGLDKSTQKFIIDGQEVTYVEQAKLELNRFIDKGFASYLRITQDLVQYGKKQGWPFSPRGSCGGSLVCYLLGISCIDPMLWGLSNDRFLSPSRGGYMLNIKMPEA